MAESAQPLRSLEEALVNAQPGQVFNLGCKGELRQFETDITATLLPSVLSEMSPAWSKRTDITQAILPVHGFLGEWQHVRAIMLDEPFDALLSKEQPPRAVISDLEWYRGHVIGFRVLGEAVSTGRGVVTSAIDSRTWIWQHQLPKDSNPNAREYGRLIERSEKAVKDITRLTLAATAIAKHVKPYGIRLNHGSKANPYS